MNYHSLVRSTDDSLKLQRDITSIAEWSKANALDIHVSKCCIVKFDNGDNIYMQRPLMSSDFYVNLRTILIGAILFFTYIIDLL